MNDDSNTTAAPERATPKHTMPRANLEKLSMKGLHSVYEVVCLAIDTLQGIICQPRYSDSGSTLNPAGDVVDDLIEHLFDCRSLIVDVADTSEPSEPSGAEMRAWILLHRAAADHDHLQDFVALAAQLVARQAHVEFHAKRRVAA